jgi:hypothetical protein
MGGDLTMKKACIFFAAIMVVLVNVQPAMANLGPDPHVPMALALMVLGIALLSLLGGAYAIIDRKGIKKRPVIKGIVAVFGVGAPIGIDAGIGLIMAVIFSIYALFRAVQMLIWSVQARSFHKDRAHIAGASPLRLAAAGVSLIILTVFLMGMVVTFAGYGTWFDRPRMQEIKAEEEIRLFTYYQIAYARSQAEKTGQMIYGPLPAEIVNEIVKGTGFVKPSPHIRIEYSPDRKHFTAFRLPDKPFPFFPYNYLTTQPSYRADETGEIRMIRVHRKDQLCPEDAPVVMRIENRDIEDAMF